MSRPTYRVSVKIALVATARQAALVIESSSGRYSLPGGHLEIGEDIEAAARRELFEELGIRYHGQLQKADFWLDPDGDRIILGYIGELDETALLTFDGREVAAVHWCSKQDIISGAISTRQYDQFMLSALARAGKVADS